MRTLANSKATTRLLVYIYIQYIGDPKQTWEIRYENLDDHGAGFELLENLRSLTVVPL